MRFKITWANCEYRVSIPSYKGGEVVTADEHDALLTRHNALVEAVAWVKECELVRHYVIFEALETCALREITSSISSARAEVDRLIADCKGEG